MADTGNPTLGQTEEGPDFVHALDQKNPKMLLYMGVALAFVGGAVALLLALG